MKGQLGDGINCSAHTNAAEKIRVEENFKIKSKNTSNRGRKDNTNREETVEKRTPMCITFNAEDRVKRSNKEKTTKQSIC